MGLIFDSASASPSLVSALATVLPPSVVQCFSWRSRNNAFERRITGRFGLSGEYFENSVFQTSLVSPLHPRGGSPSYRPRGDLDDGRRLIVGRCEPGYESSIEFDRHKLPEIQTVFEKGNFARQHRVLCFVASYGIAVRLRLRGPVRSDDPILYQPSHTHMFVIHTFAPGSNSIRLASEFQFTTV